MNDTDLITPLWLTWNGGRFARFLGRRFAKDKFHVDHVTVAQFVPVFLDVFVGVAHRARIVPVIRVVAALFGSQHHQINHRPVTETRPTHQVAVRAADADRHRWDERVAVTNFQQFYVRHQPGSLP